MIVVRQAREGGRDTDCGIRAITECAERRGSPKGGTHICKRWAGGAAARPLITHSMPGHRPYMQERAGTVHQRCHVGGFDKVSNS